jgi:hypothetical protein
MMYLFPPWPLSSSSLIQGKSSGPVRPQVQVPVPQLPCPHSELIEEHSRTTFLCKNNPTIIPLHFISESDRAGDGRTGCGSFITVCLLFWDALTAVLWWAGVLIFM